LGAEKGRDRLEQPLEEPKERLPTRVGHIHRVVAHVGIAVPGLRVSWPAADWVRGAEARRAAVIIARQRVIQSAFAVALVAGEHEFAVGGVLRVPRLAEWIVPLPADSGAAGTC